MKKVIILDIDGTLTNTKKIITEKTKESLKKAQANGALLILASGRPTQGLIEYAKQLDMHKNNGLLVSFNGAEVINVQTHEVLYKKQMSANDAKAVLKHIENFNVKAIIDKDDYMYVKDVYDWNIKTKEGYKNMLQYESRGNKYKLCEVESLIDFVDFDVNKILTCGDYDYLHENYEAMMVPFKDKLNCVFTGPVYFEFTAKNVDKAKALDSVLIPLGYTKEDMIAFGDGHNDKTMVEYAGVGVAMANAVIDLKEVADVITDSNDEDGIANYLNKYIL